MHLLVAIRRYEDGCTASPRGLKLGPSANAGRLTAPDTARQLGIAFWKMAATFSRYNPGFQGPDASLGLAATF